MCVPVGKGAVILQVFSEYFYVLSQLYELANIVFIS
jgi:hypothetical protein